MREPGDPLVGRQGVVNITGESVMERLTDWPSMKACICQARAMRQEVFEGDEAFSRICFVEWSVGRAEDAHLGKLRGVARDGIVQGDAAFIDHGERCRGCDRLRHGGDSEDGVGLDRQFAFDVAPTVAGCLCGAVSPQVAYGSREFARIDELLNGLDHNICLL